MSEIGRSFWTLFLAGSAMGAPPAPDANDYVEDFESYTPHVSLASNADYVPLKGQVSPDGFIWSSSAFPPFLGNVYSGVVTNAIAQTGGNWNPLGSAPSKHGVVGGPDPTGAHGQFWAHPRGSISPQAYNEDFAFGARRSQPLYVADAQTPLVIAVEMYLDDVATLTWFRPVSFAQGLITANVFIGGIVPCPGFIDSCDIIQDYVTFSGATGDGGAAFFAAEGLRIAEDEWFHVAIRLTPQGVSAWIRNAETLGANASGVPFDAPGYVGEIFDTGWAQVFPGIEDDPLTAVIEGPGLALTGDMFTENREASPTIIDETGAVAAPILYAQSVDQVWLLGDYDPIPGSTFHPYEPHDWYADNYMALGTPGCLPDPAFSVPQAIDGADLAALLADWGTNASRSDFDESAVVDGYDLALLLSKWGPCLSE